MAPNRLPGEGVGAAPEEGVAVEAPVKVKVGLAAGVAEEGFAPKRLPVEAWPELEVEAPSAGLLPNKPPDGGAIAPGVAVEGLPAGLEPNMPPEGGADSAGFAPNRPPDGAVDAPSAGFWPNIFDGGAVDGAAAGFWPNMPPEGAAEDEASAGLAPNRPPEGAAGAAEPKTEGAAGFDAAALNMLVGADAGGGPEGVVEKDKGDGLGAAGVVAPLEGPGFMAKRPP